MDSKQASTKTSNKMIQKKNKCFLLIRQLKIVFVVVCKLKLTAMKLKLFVILGKKYLNYDNLLNKLVINYIFKADIRMSTEYFSRGIFAKG